MTGVSVVEADMVSDHSHGTEVLPIAQSDLALVQLCAVSVLLLVPSSRAWHLPLLPLLGELQSSEVISLPALLQNGHPKCPQPHLVGCAF